MRLKLIACEIVYREICAVVSRSVNQVDVTFLSKGLHDLGSKGMFAQIRDAIDAIEPDRYDAVLLGYALCSNGILGLQAKTVPLVVPRAHDCITFFLGEKQRYLEYFRANPGVYFKTSGWIERGEGLEQSGPDSIQQRQGMTMSLEELKARYGEDNAQFLFEQLGDMTRNYRKLTYIAMGVGPEERLEELARKEAAERGWEFERLEGNLSLLQSLVDGPWDDDRFLVVPPGNTIEASFDDQIVRIRPLEAGQSD